MLFLVGTDRHKIRLVEQDVGGHQHWIIEEGDVDIRLVLLGFILKLGHAVEFTHIRECI